jgi:hypothetical protein
MTEASCCSKEQGNVFARFDISLLLCFGFFAVNSEQIQIMKERQ